MEFVDTHCHIHEASARTDGDAAPATHGGQAFVHDKWAKAGFTDAVAIAEDSVKYGVTRLICVGCTLHDSEMAVELAAKQANCWASIGIHPHEAKDHLDAETQKNFAKLVDAPRVVAIGECGLDYYYSHSDKADQIKLLEFQLDLAQKHDMPLIFHVRDATPATHGGQAFDDFWSVYDQFKGLRGVIHSFSSSPQVLEQILSRGLYVGLNGIMTFTKNTDQLQAAKSLPLDKLLLETDAPFLTPAPNRSIICQPKHVRVTAEFLAGLRDEDIKHIAEVTTQNACNLFALK